MSQQFNPQEITYIGSNDLDSGSRVYTFEYLYFLYDVHTLDGQVQFIKGQRGNELKTNGETPTQEELELHDERKEIYNNNHQPIQDWVNSL